MPSSSTESTAPGMPQRLPHITRPIKMLMGVRFSDFPAVWDGVATVVSHRLSVLVSGFGVGFSSVHTTLVVGSGRRFMMFQDVSGSAVNGHVGHAIRGWFAYYVVGSRGMARTKY